MGGDNVVVFWLWIAPELVSLLFILFWPAISRHWLEPHLTKGATELELDPARARAMASFSQDTTLATNAVISSSFSLLKLLAMIYTRSGGIPLLVIVIAFIYAFCGPWLLVWLHMTNSAKPYLTVNTDGIAPIWSTKPKGRYRVAGRVARRIFWTRLLIAIGSLGIAVWSGLRLVVR